MTQPFVGEIQLFGFNFNPRGWAFCNGATLPISQNTALFSLLGTRYGGNGTTTFQLPNLAARATCQQGQGPGLSQRTIGQAFGAASAALSVNQLPLHNHVANAFSQPDPAKRVAAPVVNGGLAFLDGTTTAKTYAATAPNTQLAAVMIQPNPGSGLDHENRQPYLGMNYCIALQGIYPSFP